MHPASGDLTDFFWARRFIHCSLPIRLGGLPTVPGKMRPSKAPVALRNNDVSRRDYRACRETATPTDFFCARLAAEGSFSAQ